MILETIRIIADALENATYGVNAQLTTLDIDSGDSTPQDIKTFADETRDILVALLRPVEPFPSLDVALNGSVELDEEVLTTVRDGEIPVRIRIAISNDQADEGTRDAYYYLRAIEKCLRDLGANENVADRERNNIQVHEYLDWRVIPHFSKIEDANGLVTLQIEITVRVRDINP